MVMHNTIRIKGATSVGIVAAADGGSVINNHVISEGASAQGLFIVGDNGYIAHNKVEGTGLYAINVAPLPIKSFLTGSYNFFQGNNYNLFNLALFDLHFANGANHNVFVGHSGNVSDDGIDNRITNFPLLGNTSQIGTKIILSPYRSREAMINNPLSLLPISCDRFRKKVKKPVVASERSNPYFGDELIIGDCFVASLLAMTARGNFTTTLPVVLTNLSTWLGEKH